MCQHAPSPAVRQITTPPTSPSTSLRQKRLATMHPSRRTSIALPDEAETLCYLSALELATGYRAGRFTPSEVVEAILAQIQRLNPAVNAFCTITGVQAREQ